MKPVIRYNLDGEDEVNLEKLSLDFCQSILSLILLSSKKITFLLSKKTDFSSANSLFKYIFINLADHNSP